MILQAIGDYKGPPIGYYMDLRYARVALDMLKKSEAPFIEAGHTVAYLMHYYIHPSGQVQEIAQIDVA